MLNSVVSAYYYLRVVLVMYLEPAPSDEKVPSSYAFRVALGLSTLAVLAVGVVPGPLLKLAELSVVTLPNVGGRGLRGARAVTGAATPGGGRHFVDTVADQC